MVESRVPISISEAIEKVVEAGVREQSQCVEKVSLMEADSRFLAEDLIAIQAVPAFNRSLYDGYALQAESTSEHQWTEFEVIAEIGAGNVFQEEVLAGQAVRIMTGAEVPDSCNAVVMFEHVEELPGAIKVYGEIPAGQHVFRKGSEIEAGTCLVGAGTQITPGIIGLLATFGYSEVSVSRKPVVGVIATGSELLDIDEPLVPGKIRNSNSYMLLSQITRAGGEPVYLGKLEDDLETCIDAVQSALKQVDILITTGGVSVGDFDFLPEIYRRIGATVLFNKIAMRPGSVTTVATLGKQLLFGLSGNPSASFIGFELFVRPVIRTYLGNDQPYLACVNAVMLDDYPVPNAFYQLVRTKISYEHGFMYVSSNGLNISSSITSIAGVDALLVLPPTTEGYQKGSRAQVLLLSEKDGQSESSFRRDRE